MLHKLIAELSRDGCSSHSIIALNDENAFDFDRLGVDVTLANLSGTLGAPFALQHLKRLAAKLQPDVVHGWMYHANAVACLIAPRKTPVIVGIRCTLAASQEKMLTRASIWLGPTLIKARGARVVYCSMRSREQHEGIGYPSTDAAVIPNGFDCDLFKPDPQARARLLSELGLPANARIVGHAARFHPMKNHASLIRAFSSLAMPDAHLVLAGREVTPDNASLARIVEETGIAGRVHLLGERADMNRILPAFDIYASSSAWGEAFPNVLGEAMASGVPCVATDVGESAMIVTDTGRIVPPGDDTALARAMENILGLPPDERKRLGERARARIVEEFSLERVAGAYADMYASLSLRKALA